MGPWMRFGYKRKVEIKEEIVIDWAEEIKNRFRDIVEMTQLWPEIQEENEGI